jgi:hypothetical protein
MKFVFKIGNHINFQCKLVSEQCSSKCRNGASCKRRVVMGLPYCWNHLLIEKHLRVKKSTIPHGGKGLYALDNSKGNEIIFRKGDKIIEYEGERIDEEEINRRYGNTSAPYTLNVDYDENIDCACQRGAGAIANTNKGHNNAIFDITGNKKVYLMATKNIRNNTEIWCSYGRTYKMNGNFTHTTK